MRRWPTLGGSAQSASLPKLPSPTLACLLPSWYLAFRFTCLTRAQVGVLATSSKGPTSKGPPSTGAAQAVP